MSRPASTAGLHLAPGGDLVGGCGRCHDYLVQVPGTDPQRVRASFRVAHPDAPHGRRGLPPGWYRPASSPGAWSQ